MRMLVVTLMCLAPLLLDIPSYGLVRAVSSVMKVVMMGSLSTLLTSPGLLDVRFTAIIVVIVGLSIATRLLSVRIVMVVVLVIR